MMGDVEAKDLVQKSSHERKTWPKVGKVGIVVLNWNGWLKFYGGRSL